MRSFHQIVLYLSSNENEMDCTCSTRGRKTFLQYSVRKTEIKGTGERRRNGYKDNIKVYVRLGLEVTERFI
jgi:hypothetical protein